MNSGMFIRSNGDLVCWDDAGRNELIQKFDPTIDYARDVYLGAPYNRLREELRSGKMPCGAVCSKCLAMNPTQAFNEVPAVKKGSSRVT